MTRRLGSSFGRKRNITSHSYDEVQAHEVLSVMPLFLTKVRSVLASLAKANAH